MDTEAAVVTEASIAEIMAVIADVTWHRVTGNREDRTGKQRLKNVVNYLIKGALQCALYS